MVSLTIPLSVEQLQELARQLSPKKRQALLESLLAERFEAVLGESDRGRSGQAALADEQIQEEVDSVRGARRERRERAPGG